MGDDNHSFKRRFQELKARFEERPAPDATEALADFEARREAATEHLDTQKDSMRFSFEHESTTAREQFERFRVDVVSSRETAAGEGSIVRANQRRLEQQIKKAPRHTFEELRQRVRQKP